MRGGFVKFSVIIFVFLAGGVTSDHHQKHKKFWNSKSDTKRSTIILKLTGNVFPQGHYYAEVFVGQPPKPYFLDPDTGSSLTWLQCNAPCQHCIKGYHPWYPPTKDLVPKTDPMCAAQHSGGVYRRDENFEQCDYEVEYADGLSTLGVLLWDHFSVKITGGTSLSPRLVLGCGYDQEASSSDHHPMDGVLGLGKGKTSILSQLHDQGLINNVVGHCLSSKKGGGFLFLGGDNVYDPNKLSWTPLSSKDNTPYYKTGPAELIFDGKSVGLKDLVVVFDSGVTFSYLTDKTYTVVLSLIKKELRGKPLFEAPEDDTLAVCWKGKKRFKDVSEVKQYFKTLVLSFSNGKTRFEITSEGYLIISSKGNACLGILNGTEIGLPVNMVGDIWMQDKMVVYDNEKGAIGWMVANCDVSPKTTNYTI